jgi:hypothetical protein
MRRTSLKQGLGGRSDMMVEPYSVIGAMSCPFCGSPIGSTCQPQGTARTGRVAAASYVPLALHLSKTQRRELVAKPRSRGRRPGALKAAGPMGHFDFKVA